MQPIIGIDNTGDVVPTGVMAQPMPVQQQHPAVAMPRGGNGLQIPTSMEQMKGQATTLLKKIAPTPPAQPPAQSPNPKSEGIQSGPMQLGGGDSHDTDLVIGGKTLFLNDYRKTKARFWYADIRASICPDFTNLH